ncbi:MAG: GNAT family N-acetyltransferase [Candidatus Omnitrophica bacterium]|nr:GNAT family N-acetyltransferase [Candidatus Omnitrophota bacterium]
MLTIRKCHPNDQNAARNLIVRIMGEEFPKESSSFPVDDLDEIGSSYGKLGEAFFVAVTDGKIVGTIGVKQEDKRTAMLRRFFVDSGCRGKRIGSQLLDRAIEFCREVGYDEVIFKTTSTMENAVHLCERRGFLPRAKLEVGAIKLLKFALFLKGEAAAAPSHKVSS